MADVVVNPILLVSGVPSASTTDAAGGVAIANAAADNWSIRPLVLATGSLPTGDHLLLKFLGAAATTGIRIVAGVRPPAQRQGLGDLVFALTNTQVMYIVIETARFLQADGSIDIWTTGGENATRCAVFQLPKAH
jgi:hypothetical protein